VFLVVRALGVLGTLAWFGLELRSLTTGGSPRRGKKKRTMAAADGSPQGARAV
jgi:hypothetical protein